MLQRNTVALFVLGTISWLGLSYAHEEKISEKQIHQVLEQLHKDKIFSDTTRKSPLKLGFARPRSDYYGQYSFGERPRTYVLGNLSPKNIKPQIGFDNKTKSLLFSQKIGNSVYNSSQINLANYQKVGFAQQSRSYWKSLQADPSVGLVSGDGILPKLKLPKGFGAILGSDEIDIQPKGMVVLDVGGRWQSVANPQIPVGQQSNGGLFFDQQISLNLVGKIGEFIPVNINWDTKSTFQFENLFKIGYEAKEEDIVQEVRLGNVSMPVSNSLIRGGQNLMGVQTRLRFGKLWLNSVFSTQRGTAEQLVIRAGAAGRNFEIRADQYQNNQHFFLSQFFRQRYEAALRTSPVITSGIVITRVEAYITNRNNNTQTLRNVVGLLDLGDANPLRKDSPAIGQGKGGAARNDANDLLNNLKNLNRDANTVTPVLDGTGFALRKSLDYELLRGARKLSPQEFSFHPNLGYVSLITPLRNDEILAVSYEYTFNGVSYKVGELTEDYQNFKDTDVIFLKLLKPSSIRTDLPTWDLMMKNIYSLQTNQLDRQNFQLRIIYRDDATGMDNPNLQEGIKTKDLPLVQVLGMDKLNMSNDPQPDGNFDFVEGITVNAQNGRVIFPVLEPFGSYLKNLFDPELERQLINKYVFDELYTGTQADAMLLTSKSKFFIKGSYQGVSSNQIQLPGINISPNSVSVRAGSTVLREGADYSVDYQFGRVNIINQGVLSSAKEIIIQYERADLFNFQTRNLFGVDAEYRLNKDVRFTGTILHLNERPNITRVSLGNEPTRNSLWGLGMDYRSKSLLLTKLVDKLPFLQTKAESNVSFKTEFAQIIPSTNALIARDGGTAYIEDFEGAEIPYDMTRQPMFWTLGSTPQQFINKNAKNPLEYAYQRAKLAWYTIDNTAFYSSGLGFSPPPNIGDAEKRNHYTRQINFNEIFQGKDQQILNVPEPTLDLAFYPFERGQYNFNTDLTTDGWLRNPQQNFGAISRGFTYDPDFDNINIQYIEFWLLDPFIKGKNGEVVTKINGQTRTFNNNTGGSLYFNLGNISEDVIPDGRHGFENGLPPNENVADTVHTAWGVVTNKQYLTNAFDAEPGARARQDVGFDGLNDEAERQKFANYLNEIRAKLRPEVYQNFENDPSNDNFRYYLGAVNDQNDFKVLDRYKQFNGSDGNSPENAGTASSTTLPDNEDLNRDNTLSDLEAYYEYKVDLEPNLNSRYIVDRVIANSNGENVTWYQFRIPIREFTRKVGDIEGFKSIRFIRAYMTGWREPVVLRMAKFQLVGTQWRPFIGELKNPGLNLPIEPYDPSFTVSTIGIEENPQTYNIPPGFRRDVDFASNTNARFNERSLRLTVSKLKDRDSRAVYKNYNFDLVNYERIKMFIHAHDDETRDNEMSAFLRLGTDFKDNYYEIEVPLKMSPRGSLEPTDLWLADNEIDVAIGDLINTKAERNRNGLAINVPYQVEIGRFKISVVGNPDLSNVQTLMIGLRNPESPDGQSKSVTVWVNELRATGFNTRSGWALNSQLNVQLADLGTVTGSLRYTSPFFGGIQDKISQRTRSHDLNYDISGNFALDRFLPKSLGISLPLFVGYEKFSSTPYFNPFDPDTPMELAKNSYKRVDNIEDYVTSETTRRSINLTNVKINKAAKFRHPLSLQNFALNLSYADINTQNPQTALYQREHSKVGLIYTYSSPLPPFEPFRKTIAFDAPYLRFIKEFNLNLLPNEITIRADLDRIYTKTQLRNADLGTAGIPANYEKAFTFRRDYALRWAITKNLNIDYIAKAFAIIDEPAGEINTQIKRDSIWTNLQRLGRIKDFQQNLGLLYRLPFDKFPLTDWISTDYKYSGTYAWIAGAVGVADSLGNMAQNSQQQSLTGQLNFERLYNKSPWLRSISSPNKNEKLPVAGEAREKRIQARIKLKQDKKSFLAQKLRQLKADAKADTFLLPKKDYEKLARKSNRIEQKINRLEDKLTIMTSPAKLARTDKKTKKLRDKQKLLYDKFNQKRQSVLEKKQQQNPNDTLKPDFEVRFEKLISQQDEKVQNLEKKLVEVRKKVRERQEAQKDTLHRNEKTIRAVVRPLLLVRRVNFSYTQDASTILPGLLTSPNFLGMNSTFESPDWKFVFGGQDAAIKDRAARNNWLGKSEVMTNAFRQNRTINLNIRADLMPLPEFDLRVEFRKAQNDTYSEIFRFDPSQDAFVSQAPSRMGNYKVSYFALRTAFVSDDLANNSPLFDDFIRNRNLIKNRLDLLNQNGTYQNNSQDVLIPAFLAAYSGRTAQVQALNAFPNFPMPNWNLTYNGLAKLPFFKKYLQSVQLTHAYNSEYGVGNFASSLLYSAAFLNLNLGLQDLPFAIQDPQTGLIVPLLVTDQINITEAFNPLIGLNVRTKDNLTGSLRINRQRSMALTLSNAQVTEIKSMDVTLDVAWTKSKFKIPFKIGGKQKILKNDLTFRLAFTLRDTKTAQRKIVDELQSSTVTQGNMNLQIKPTIAYVVSERLNLQFYFDHTLNQPYISNSFRRTNTNFGVQLRYNL